ncbi:MAG TPA: hypothetical protein PKL69_04460 [Agitococcus sp.]|nr:hypothetical protein [Agitococcus sp.]
MQNKPIYSSIILLLCLSSTSLANDFSDNKRLYRYYNDKGIPTVSDQVSEEHIRRGYDIVDRQMQVIRRIPPFDEAVYQKDKAKRDNAFKQQQEDAKILRLYSSARDAELARNRQLDTLSTGIGYNSIQLQRIKRLRANFVEEAAATERASKKSDPKVKLKIAEYDKQILDLQALINYQKMEQQKVGEEFKPIIKRLLEIELQEKTKEDQVNTSK